jgi:15-cis-phytoene synthase
MIAEIRRAWWLETVEGARAGKPRPHDVARALAETLAVRDLPQRWFDAMVEARAADSAPEPFANQAALLAYADATSGNLMRLAARVLGGDGDAPAREAGVAYALAGLLRAAPFHAARGTRFMTDEDEAVRLARSHYEAAQKIAMPREALPAFMPAALVPLYLKNLDPPLWRKQIVFLCAAMRGRI